MSYRSYIYFFYFLWVGWPCLLPAYVKSSLETIKSPNGYLLPDIFLVAPCSGDNSYLDSSGPRALYSLEQKVEPEPAEALVFNWTSCVLLFSRYSCCFYLSTVVGPYHHHSSWCCHSKPVMSSLSWCRNPFLSLLLLSISLYLLNLLWFFALFTPVLLFYNLRSVEEDISFFFFLAHVKAVLCLDKDYSSSALKSLIPDYVDKPWDASALICSSELYIKQNMHLISLTCN